MDVEQDVVVSKSSNETNQQADAANHDVTKGVVAIPEASLKEVVRQVMVTEGELIPWKGFWWKVHLNNETRAVELQQVKPAASTTKLVDRALRWRKQHRKATDGLRVGSASGLRVRPAESRSTELQK